MFKRLSKRAQTTAEYAILIAIVVGAVVAMQIYIKRGLQGRVKDVVDYTGADMMSNANSNMNFGSGQYEPYYLNAIANSTQLANESVSLNKGGGSGIISNVESTSNKVQTLGW